jgi:hypothetical protein
MVESHDVEPPASLIRRYYAALELSEPLAPFYARDAETGALGPVVKIGSGKGEEFAGYAAVEQAVNQVTATFRHNRLESRALAVRRQGDLAWFSDLVWWSGEQVAAGDATQGTAEYQRFASLTRWTGLCLRTPAGWRFLQLHVSEGL